MDSIVDLIRTVEKRTTMYIGKNDIYCLQAFIEGWILRNTESISDIEVLNQFQVWIVKKYSINTTQSWASIIAFFAMDYKDEIPLFFDNFNAFIKEIESNHPSDSASI